MTTRKKFNFINQTLKFCIAGFFIPGFTAIAILALQMGIGLLGIECSKSWIVVWTLTTVGAVVSPFVFVRLMNKRLLEGYNLTANPLIVFNIIEYAFIQSTLAAFFTRSQTLCYVSDGQNGLEFVFTGWMSMPFLVVLSLVFDNIRDRRTEQLKADRIAKE
jgi:hypothetical protein